MDEYRRILAEDIALINEASRQLEETNFGFDTKLQKELDSLMSKAYTRQDDLLRTLTEEIRGLEDDTDQAMMEEQKSLQNNLALLEKSKSILADTQAEKVKTSQIVVAEETEKQKLDQQVQEFQSKALITVDMEKNFPNLRRLKSLLYKGTRLTWGKSKNSKEADGSIIRGFVTSHDGADVQTFELDKTNLNKKCVQDFVWDYIGAGISNEWKKVGKS